MAGGSGTRFWPKSRAALPKQLLSFGQHSGSLLQMTLDRFDSIVEPENKVIVTTEILKDEVARQSPESIILAEPQGRNTAPCIYWASKVIAQKDPDAIMIVVPSDHFLRNISAYREVINQAVERAQSSNDLVTLGVKPTFPATGFGYLKASEDLGGGCLKVEAFVEKPNEEKAKSFIDQGHYYWNAGMFVWSVRAILESFKTSMPEYESVWEATAGNVQAAYPQLEATSIDYGIMERAKNVVTFTLDCGWSDLGSWPSLDEVAEELDAKVGNNVVVSGDIISVESENNIVDVPSRLVALVGINDLVVVEHGNALLVMPKNKAQDVKKVVETLKTLHPDYL